MTNVLRLCSILLALLAPAAAAGTAGGKAESRLQLFQAWLLQMAKNISIDHYRRRRRKKQDWETARPIEEIPIAVEDRGGDSAASDLRSAFSRSVETLAKRQRMVFVMRHYNELPFNEISEAMRISIGTAKSLHFKAVQNLRKRLAPVLGMEP